MNIDNFISVVKQGLSLDHIYILNLSCYMDISTIDSPKIVAIIKALIRKDLLTAGYALTIDGAKLAALWEMNDVVELSLTTKKIKDAAFERWWKAYPPTDTFEYKGTKFIGARSLRKGADECCIKLNKILAEGEHTIDTLINALEFEVAQKKENSLKTKTNKLQFMQNSLTYLNQRSYEGFIELMKTEGTKPKIEFSKPTEIEI